MTMTLAAAKRAASTLFSRHLASQHIARRGLAGTAEPSAAEDLTKTALYELHKGAVFNVYQPSSSKSGLLRQSIPFL